MSTLTEGQRIRRKFSTQRGVIVHQPAWGSKHPVPMARYDGRLQYHRLDGPMALLIREASR